MINILEVCNESGILSVVYFVKKMLELVFIILPIILIVMILMDFTKNVMAKGDDDIKRNNKVVIKRIVYCIMAFFVPTIVNVVINAVYSLTSDGGNNENALVCWEKATIDNIKDLRDKEEAERKAEEDRKYQENKKEYESDEEEKKNQGTNSLSGKDPEEDNTGTTGNGGTTTNPGTTTVNNYTLYVGDSRTVGMCSAITLSSNEECKAQESQGHTWLTGNAIHTIEARMKEHPEGNLVINLGINDLGNVSSYISTYKTFASKYPNAKIVAVSLTPVENYPSITNSQVDDFNAKLKSGLSSTNIKFCDINDKITGTGITTDGVHHTPEVYKQIHELIKQCL